MALGSLLLGEATDNSKKPNSQLDSPFYPIICHCIERQMPVYFCYWPCLLSSFCYQLYDTYGALYGIWSPYGREGERRKKPGPEGKWPRQHEPLLCSDYEKDKLNVLGGSMCIFRYPQLMCNEGKTLGSIFYRSKKSCS